MTATDTEGESPQEGTAAETDIDRKTDLQLGAASAVMARYAGEDFGPEDIDEWEPLSSGVFRIDRFAPEVRLGTFDSGEVGGDIEGPFTDNYLQVNYEPDGVYLDIMGDGELTRLGMLLRFDPAEARQLAGAIYAAAWELENRPREANDG